MPFCKRKYLVPENNSAQIFGIVTLNRWIVFFNEYVVFFPNSAH